MRCFSVALFVYALYPLQDEIDELVVTYQVLSTVASERTGTMNFVCVVVAALEPRIALYVCFLIFCVFVVVRFLFFCFLLCVVFAFVVSFCALFLCCPRVGVLCRTVTGDRRVRDLLVADVSGCCMLIAVWGEDVMYGEPNQMLLFTGVNVKDWM